MNRPNLDFSAPLPRGMKPHPCGACECGKRNACLKGIPRGGRNCDFCFEVQTWKTPLGWFCWICIEVLIREGKKREITLENLDEIQPIAKWTA